MDSLPVLALEINQCPFRDMWSTPNFNFGMSWFSSCCHRGIVFPSGIQVSVTIGKVNVCAFSLHGDLDIHKGHMYGVIPFGLQIWSLESGGSYPFVAGH